MISPQNRFSLGICFNITKYQHIAKRVLPLSQVFDVGFRGCDLGCSLKEKNCTVIGWGWKLGRIDKNPDFYKLLEERDVKRGIGERKILCHGFSQCTWALVGCWQGTATKPGSFKCEWEGFVVTYEYSFFREPSWPFIRLLELY